MINETKMDKDYKILKNYLKQKNSSDANYAEKRILSQILDYIDKLYERKIPMSIALHKIVNFILVRWDSILRTLPKNSYKRILFVSAYMKFHMLLLDLIDDYWDRNNGTPSRIEMVFPDEEDDDECDGE